MAAVRTKRSASREPIKPDARVLDIEIVDANNCFIEVEHRTRTKIACRLDGGSWFNRDTGDYLSNEWTQAIIGAYRVDKWDTEDNL